MRETEREERGLDLGLNRAQIPLSKYIYKRIWVGFKQVNGSVIKKKKPITPKFSRDFYLGILGYIVHMAIYRSISDQNEK